MARAVGRARIARLFGLGFASRLHRLMTRLRWHETRVRLMPAATDEIAGIASVRLIAANGCSTVRCWMAQPAKLPAPARGAVDRGAHPGHQGRGRCGDRWRERRRPAGHFRNLPCRHQSAGLNEFFVTLAAMEQVQTRWNGWGVPGHDDPLAVNEPAWRWLAQAFAMPALLATPPRELSAIALPPSRLNEHARTAYRLLGHVEQGIRARAPCRRPKLDRFAQLRAGDLSTAPDAILYPRRESDVVAALKLCAELGIAVVPWGGGTGHATLARGAHPALVVLSLSEINRLKTPDMMSGLAEVEAGVTGPIWSGT
jgi:hypothetical protein